MPTFRTYKCNLFYCPMRKAYSCCSCCERKAECESSCKNVPEKCGYSTARINSDEVICPFFAWTSYRNESERKQLVCEGLINSTKDAVQFNTEREKSKHMVNFCCGEYVSCAKARELLRMYDTGEKRGCPELKK